jgi:hypothetical protein
MQRQAMDIRLARVEGSVSEVSHGLSQLTWAVNLWGAVIPTLLAMTLAMI